MCLGLGAAPFPMPRAMHSTVQTCSILLLLVLVPRYPLLPPRRGFLCKALPPFALCLQFLYVRDEMYFAPQGSAFPLQPLCQLSCATSSSPCGSLQPLRSLQPLLSLCPPEPACPVPALRRPPVPRSRHQQAATHPPAPMPPSSPPGHCSCPCPTLPAGFYKDKTNLLVFIYKHSFIGLLPCVGFFQPPFLSSCLLLCSEVPVGRGHPVPEPVFWLTLPGVRGLLRPEPGPASPARALGAPWVSRFQRAPWGEARGPV